MSHAKFSPMINNNWETLFNFQICSGHLGFRDGPGYPQIIEVSKKVPIFDFKDKNNLIIIYHMSWHCKQRVKARKMCPISYFVGHLGFLEAPRGYMEYQNAFLSFLFSSLE